MKARFGNIEIEGTAAEVAALIRELDSEGMAGPSVSSPQNEHGKFVSEDVAFKALRRRRLSPEQEAIIKVMKRNHPNWTTARELQLASNYSPSQLAGLLGALGKRVYATEGYVDGTWFLDQEWDYEEGANKYRLPDAVLAAAQRANL